MKNNASSPQQQPGQRSMRKAIGFLLERKVWILLPLWLLLALIAAILALTGSPYIMPVLYVAF